MFLILLILIQCLMIFLISLYFDHLDNRNVDFFSTLQASNLISIQASLNTNVVWGILLFITSFILESNSLSHLTIKFPEILYNGRYYIYIFACVINIFSTYVYKQSIAKIDIYLKKSTNLEKSTTLLLNYYEKQIELAERRLNLFKSFSFLPVVILFVNNLNTLKQSNTNVQFESLIFIDPVNVYLLLSILAYFLFTYNSYRKCQNLTRFKIFILAQLHKEELKKSIQNMISTDYLIH